MHEKSVISFLYYYGSEINLKKSVKALITILKKNLGPKTLMGPKSR